MAQPIYYEDDTVALKGIKSSFAAQCELELQYSQQLGRLAELCDIVIPWVINQFNSDKIVPPDVVKAVMRSWATGMRLCRGTQCRPDKWR